MWQSRMEGMAKGESTVHGMTWNGTAWWAGQGRAGHPVAGAGHQGLGARAGIGAQAVARAATGGMAAHGMSGSRWVGQGSATQ